MQQASAEALRAIASLVSAHPYPCLPPGLLPRAVPEPVSCALLDARCELCLVDMRRRAKKGDAALRLAALQLPVQQQEVVDHLRYGRHDKRLRARIGRLVGAVVPCL